MRIPARCSATSACSYAEGDRRCAAIPVWALEAPPEPLLAGLPGETKVVLPRLWRLDRLQSQSPTELLRPHSRRSTRARLKAGRMRLAVPVQDTRVAGVRA